MAQKCGDFGRIIVFGLSFVIWIPAFAGMSEFYIGST